MAPTCRDNPSQSVSLRSVTNKISNNGSVRRYSNIGANPAAKNAKKRPRAAIATTFHTGAQVACSKAIKWPRLSSTVTSSFGTSDQVKGVVSTSKLHPAMASDEAFVSDPGSPSSQTSQDSGGETSSTSLPSSGSATRLPSPEAPDIDGSSTTTSTNRLGRRNSLQDEQCARWLVCLSNALPMKNPKPPSLCHHVAPAFHTLPMTASLGFPNLVDFGAKQILSQPQAHIESCPQRAGSVNFVYGMSAPLGTVVTAAPSLATTESGIRKGPSGRVMRDIPGGKAPPGWIPCGKHSDSAHGGTGEKCIKWAIDNPQGRKMLKFHQKNDLGHASAKCQHCNTIKSLKNVRKHELRCVRSPSRATQM